VHNYTPFRSCYADALVALWRDSMTAATGIQPVHSVESQRYFLCEILPAQYAITVVTADSGEPIGFMASDASMISQLYIHQAWQGQGIGSTLLEQAKALSGGSLQLRTFEVNAGARRFYERHGFVAIGGDSNNEEGQPDILYRWCSTF